MLRWLAVAVVGTLLAGCGSEPEAPGARQATGVKVGEVTATTAIVWTRVTQHPERSSEGQVRRGRANRDVRELDLDVSALEGSVPGAPGKVKLRYGTAPDLADAKETHWKSVRPDDDFTYQFHLKELAPATKYYFESRTADNTGELEHAAVTGSFRTAPPPDQYGDITFTVITGQAYKDADDPEGFLVYPSMRALDPHFIVPTGDTVYYDSDDPLVTNIEVARYHWRRMYSYPKLVEFHRFVPGYWEKDDHDLYANDAWPGLSRPYMGSFTFEQGCKVFKEQTPSPPQPYRTYRWGRGLQIWLTEGREFRSPNDMPDGPDKTIWGQEQKQWLTETLQASDADWRVLVNPTPIVGPDRENKADNHANEAFRTEGDWFRQWAGKTLQENFFIACGDRHWQYHSVDPETGVQEFSSGPVSDVHASGSPGQDPVYHKFHRQMGGFLSVRTWVEAGESKIALRLHAVDGSVAYEQVHSRPRARTERACPTAAKSRALSLGL